MRPTLLLVTVLAATSAQASWFSSDKPEYQTWDEAQLKAWLQSHNIQPPPSYSSTQLQDLVKTNWDTANAWTADQYAKAQQAFVNIKDDTFAAWDESQLRQFLVEQGVVEPKGTREQLAILARQKYRSYTNYASSISASLSTRASTAVHGDRTQQASKSVTSAASVVSSSASSVYTEASSTVSSVVAQATTEVARKIDDTKDYVYSSWDESQLRQYLQDKGLVEPHAQTTKEQLLAKMKTAYTYSTDPLWSAWSDSYLRHWLIAHDLVHSNNPETDTEDFRHALAENLTREALLAKMQHYYYDTKAYVWSSWSDSQLHDWLVSHNIIKSESRLQRDKLVKMVNDNYASAEDTIWGAWSDSQMHDWLVEHGYLRTDAQKTRDELIKLMNTKYDDAAAKSRAYLVWPDARLRAYLRNRGVSEDAIPTSRPGLLQEVRIRWVQAQTGAESLIAKVTEIINSNVHYAEVKVAEILALMTGTARNAEDAARATYEDTKADVYEKAHQAQGKAERAGYEAKAQYKDAKGSAGSVAAKATGSLHATESKVSGKAGSAAAEAQKATQRVKAEL